MDIQKVSTEIDELQIAAHALDCQIDALKAEIADGYFDDEKLEELVAKSMKLGELYAQRDAKAQAVPEGFVLIPAEQLSQWGHMANHAETYGCPDCFEVRGYAHNLACEINSYFEPSEAREPTND